MRRGPESRRKWITIVLAVVLLHALVFLYVRPSLISGLLHDAEAPSVGSPSGAAPTPDAIIAIQIDVEDKWQPIDVEPIPDEPVPTPLVPAPTGEAPPGGDDYGLESLDLGDASARTPGATARGPATVNRVIPPRPVEITWPETSRLKQCIGSHVDVDVRVAEDGTVLRVDPVGRDFPEDCLRSALNAAAQIRFLPGTVDGKPATLTTRVRIDFEKRR